jgi:hypothetical protein
MKMLLAASIFRKAFVFMIKQATVAETRPAGLTIEFLAVANLVPALTAFYGSIDQLKHRQFSLFRTAVRKQLHFYNCGTCRLARFHQNKQ